MNLSEKLHPRPLFDQVTQAAQALGVETYVVGGYVRDLLLGRPCKDLDFVCVGSGIDLAMQVAAALPGQPHVSYYKNFGTAAFRYEGWELEFVGARRESYRADSRKPLVEDGTLEDDQRRRDFTINALAISLNASTFGELIDPFGGVEDLQKKIIRTPLEPGITFSDDPLRMMRACRFASQLGFDIEGHTFAALQSQQERLSIISVERTVEELNKIILSPKPSYGFKLLYHAGLLQLILPEMILLLGAENHEGKTHKDNFYHTLEVLDNVAQVSDDLWTRWSAILHDIAKPATKRFDPKIGFTFHGHEEKGARMVPGLFKRLKLPLNDKMKKVQKLVRLHLRPIALVKDSVTDSAIRRIMVEAGEDLEALMQLCRADITTKNPNKARRYLANFDKVEKRMAEVEAADSLRNFQPVITGEIIMQRYGLSPGHQVGQIKDQVREAIINGDVPNTMEGALPYTDQVAAQLGFAPLTIS